ncbi:DUF2066 domain-containing protein [Marinospirillum alkaliphilum]|uniref:DUF2066 domain-containing protein n=1 Tax=Marinospirillum alkaliphilum TaxID=148454 RepID=UPI0009310801|nr:DUF2066 domain-containing protein [Marinospirillum alkaliphilum]
MKLTQILLLAGKTLLLTLLLLQPALAERVEGLYTLRGLVPDSSDATRAKAANQMLQELLVRVSGTRKVLEKMPPEDFLVEPGAFRDHPQRALWQALSNAQTLVNQFSYSSSNELIMLENGNQVRAQQLELEFDAAGVNQLLRRMEAPVWDINRPRTLFWIALEGRQGRYLVSPQSNEPLSDALKAHAVRRGIPMVLPDSEQHPFPPTLLSDVWGGFGQQILESSAPYRPDAVVVARIQPAGNNWSVQWQLFTGMDSVWHRSSAATLGAVLNDGVDFAAEELSRRYASQPGQGAGRYRILVSDVKQARDYAELMRYLNALSLTSQVRVVQANGQQLLLEVTLRGGLDQLRANLALDGRLTEASFLGLQQLSSSFDPGRENQQQERATGQVDAYLRWQTRQE